uniref:Uncharacterized protein n=1 Tax=Phenylobacterium glaciei TaxID=2803784 RepID=A0A974P2T1_9CAUL|nr:hypothetical protein JKL49_27155 [Phenylobacterium glaciei]
MLIFVSAFALSVVAVVVYQVGWVIPGQACESKGDWWDWRGRTCAHPVLISDITGRVINNDDQRKAARKTPPTPRRPPSNNPLIPAKAGTQIHQWLSGFLAQVVTYDLDPAVAGTSGEVNALRRRPRARRRGPGHWRGARRRTAGPTAG